EVSPRSHNLLRHYNTLTSVRPNSRRWLWRSEGFPYSLMPPAQAPMNVRFCGQADFTCRSSNHVHLWSHLWRENSKASKKDYISTICGGEGGIRTLETVARLHAFQACAFDHSATSPSGK